MKKKLLLATTIFCFLNLTNAQPAHLDPAFGTNGIVTTDLGEPHTSGSPAASQIILLPDGSMYVLQRGSIPGEGISKRHEDGSIDSSFGINGFAENLGFAEKMAMGFDGKIVVISRGSEQTISRYNTDGSIDITFSEDGRQKTDMNEIYAVAVQQDGKVLLAGFKPDDVYDEDGYSGGGYLLERYNSDGSLDNTLDVKAVTDLFNPELIAIQKDGKIVVAGTTAFRYTNRDFALARYNINGSLDKTFGDDGIQTTDFASEYDVAKAVAIQSDGKIVVAGSSGSQKITLARYNIDGSLDNSFSGDGRQKTNFTGYDLKSLVFQTTGKIVVEYSIGSNDSLIQFNTDGSLDSSFNHTSEFDIESIAIRSDGKIVAAGRAGEYREFLGLARYNADGSPDKTFNLDGTLTEEGFTSNTGYKKIAVQKDGKIVAAGSKWNGSNFDFAIARYNIDGSPDMTFSGDGIQTTDFLSNNDYAKTIAIQEDGKIIVAGVHALARYNTDGSLDGTFSGDGKQMDNSIFINSADVQSDGKIVVAGASNYRINRSHAVIMRFNGDGSLDNTFGADGRQTLVLGNYGSASSIVIQNDGKIVIAGIFSDFKLYISSIILARLNTNGSLDTTYHHDGAKFFTHGTSYAITKQNNDKVVIAGTNRNRFSVGRINILGNIDNSFNAINFKNSPYSNISSIALQSDGKIVVATDSLLRFNTNGNFDSTFGGDGVQSPPFFIKDITIVNNKLYLAGGDRYGTVARYLLNGQNNTPPTVSITTPTENATFGAGAYIKINAAASDADGTISKVDFYNGNTLLHTETVAPYGYQWKHVPAGSYTLTIKATDNTGNVTTSAPVHITVVPNIAPTVSITNPANNQTIAGPSTIRLMAEAKDADGTITKVQFYNGTTLLRTETISPYTYTWNDVPAGNYAITARATDNLGVFTTSAVVNISVVPNNAPTVSITNPADNESFTAPATISLIASAQDPDGTISRVEFYNGTALLNIQYTSPFTHTMKDVPAGTYTITAKAIDNLGLSTTSAPVTVTVAASNTIVSSKPSSTDNINGAKHAVSLKVYPNPARNIINISAKGLQQNKQATISVITASGAVMKMMQSNSSTQSIQMNVSSLTKGVYVIKMNCGDKVLYKQFVKL